MSRSGSYETTEFRRSFLKETDSLLRRRLGWFVVIWGGLGLLGFALAIVAAVAFQDDAVLRLFFGAGSGWRRW